MKTTNNTYSIMHNSDLEVLKFKSNTHTQTQNTPCIFQENETSIPDTSKYNKNTGMNITGFYIEKTTSTDSIGSFNQTPQTQKALDEEILKCNSLKALSKNVNITNMKRETKEALLATIKWAEANNYDIRITSGYRDANKQKLLYKKTPNIADSPEHSMHCKGLAFDIGIYPKGSLQKNRNPKLYLQLAKYLRNEGFDIYNGREFPDSPKDGTEWWHFQIGKNDGYLFARSNKKKR